MYSVVTVMVDNPRVVYTSDDPQMAAWYARNLVVAPCIVIKRG